MTMRSRGAMACHAIAAGAVIADTAGRSRGILTCIAARRAVVVVNRGALTGIEALAQNRARIYAAAMVVISRINAASPIANTVRGCNGDDS